MKVIKLFMNLGRLILLVSVLLSKPVFANTEFLPGFCVWVWVVSVRTAPEAESAEIYQLKLLQGEFHYYIVLVLFYTVAGSEPVEISRIKAMKYVL